jgi:hypothetical protein
MSELEHDQEHERGPGGVSIWRTAKGDVRWKVTAAVGLDDAELDRALRQAVWADRELEGEYAAARKPFQGKEPAAA